MGAIKTGFFLMYATAMFASGAGDDETLRVMQELSAEIACIQTHYAPKLAHIEGCMALEKQSFESAPSARANFGA